MRAATIPSNPEDGTGAESTPDEFDHSAGRLTRLARYCTRKFGIGTTFRWRRTIRLVGVMTLDFLAVAGSLVLLLPLIRKLQLSGGYVVSPIVLVMTVAVAGVAIMSFGGLYRRSWRFTSLADCLTMGANVAVALTAIWFGIWWSAEVPDPNQILLVATLHLALAFVAMQFLRVMRRASRRLPYFMLANRGVSGAVPVNRDRALLVGRADWVESIIRITTTDGKSPIAVVGALLPETEGPIRQIHGIPVLGFPEHVLSAVIALEQQGRRPDTVMICDDAVNLSARAIALIRRRVRDLGIKIVQAGDDWGYLLGRTNTSAIDRLSTAELLERHEFELRDGAISQQIAGQSVLVTGAGGTIGGELARQLAGFRPGRLVLLDNNEFNLYKIEQQIRENFPAIQVFMSLCDVRNLGEVKRVFKKHEPSIIYHAAAIKHVPIAEANPCASAHTNIIGSKNIADALCEFGARAMVQVSTDKAVNPVGIMGASKRVGELYAQSLDLCGVDDPDAPRFMTVRFGNVLGSSGSVVPLFTSQLLAGGPLTVTHPDIERFFMTVREAVQLILESSSRALQDNAPRGRIMVLDMGEPVKIVELARRMIRLHGLEPDVDIEIAFTGLRPGEKLFEELFDSCEQQQASAIPGIFEAQSHPIPLPLITRAIEEIGVEIEKGNEANVRRIVHHLTNLPSNSPTVAGFVANSESLWRRKSTPAEEVSLS
ncbi:polysaccharide biosynthesis protein [Parerythrobacter aurantius]|uniref:polysaccharide biosynthesis protein n=1 Tax=Parerythrobacter aurantius TaxID=3127706 RepID=UPI003253AA39